MAYAALKDLEVAVGGAERLRQLADFDGHGTPNMDAVERALAKSVAWVNASLLVRYNVPLTEPVPDEVRFLVADEAVYQLQLARGMVTEADMAAHQEREKALDQLRTGERTMGVTPTPLKSSHVVDRASSPTDLRAYSRDALKGFS